MRSGWGNSYACIYSLSNLHRKKASPLGRSRFDEVKITAKHAPEILSYWGGLSEEEVYRTHHESNPDFLILIILGWRLKVERNYSPPQLEIKHSFVLRSVSYVSANWIVNKYATLGGTTIVTWYMIHETTMYAQKVSVWYPLGSGDVIGPTFLIMMKVGQKQSTVSATGVW